MNKTSADASHAPVPLQAEFDPLQKLTLLFQALDAKGITYCHWKSNYHLHHALLGEEDVDLLVAKEDFPQFVRILLELDFKQAQSISSSWQPGVEHFLGNDPGTGRLINVHTNTRILTGDHMLKSFALPVERMLLHETRELYGVRVPAQASESVIFVVRDMIKQASLQDLLLHQRAAHAVSEEAALLAQDCDQDAVLERLRRYLPEIETRDFQEATRLIGRNGAWWPRVKLGFRFQRALRKYRRYGWWSGSVLTAWIVLRMAWNRLVRQQKHMTLKSGGTVIALVGPQATGKSTLAAHIRTWLGGELQVRYIHVGKPPATWLTFLPNVLLPAARALFAKQRSTLIETQADRGDRDRYPLLFIVRKLLLAHDRRRLLTKAFRDSRNGAIVLCDRYPSDNPGAVDSASFSDEAAARENSTLKRFLMQWEQRIYREICPPDLVLQLAVPVDTAVLRNLTRQKKDGGTTDYVRLRHSMAQLPVFKHSPVVVISTDRALDQMLLEVKEQIWRYL